MKYITHNSLRWLPGATCGPDSVRAFTNSHS